MHEWDERLLRSHGETTCPVLLDWSEDDDIWLRRAAILTQLKFRDATDAALLEA